MYNLNLRSTKWDARFMLTLKNQLNQDDVLNIRFNHWWPWFHSAREGRWSGLQWTASRTNPDEIRSGGFTSRSRARRTPQSQRRKEDDKLLCHILVYLYFGWHAGRVLAKVGFQSCLNSPQRRRNHATLGILALEEWGSGGRGRSKWQRNWNILVEFKFERGARAQHDDAGLAGATAKGRRFFDNFFPVFKNQFVFKFVLFSP